MMDNNPFNDFPEICVDQGSPCNLKELEHLSISGANLSAIPEWFKRLASLTYLDISNNPFPAFPELGQIQPLQSLFVYLN